jgi:leucyl-tRNA synthetase
MEVEGQPGSAFRVFTTRPDTVYGMTFGVLAPEHPLLRQIVSPGQRAEVEAYVERASNLTEIERQSTDRRRDGVWTGAYALNPMNGRRVPVFVADYVLGSYGAGAIMAVPAHDGRDYEFARQYNLPVVEVIRDPEGTGPAVGEAYEGQGIMVNSGIFDGLPSEEAWHAIARAMEEAGTGRRTVQYRIRDWLISRQRYWGTPIPIVHCAQCGTVPVPETDLPVQLPHLPDYLPRGDGRSPLSNLPEFVATTCPRCGGPAQRETDTMGGFACSSWYFLRFADPWYAGGPFNPDAVQRWLPVDLYVGGAEHAVMHLLYARFWTKVLADAGLVDFREPFPRLRSQGVVHAADGKRMSKSRGNVVTPDEVVARYGADALRLHLLFMAPFDRNVDWDEDGIAGAQRFLQRIWHLGGEIARRSASAGQKPGAEPEREDDLRRALHKTVRRVTDDVEAYKFNTAVSAMMEFSNSLAAYQERRGPTPALSEAFEVLIRLLAPFAPHIAEEIWSRLGHGFSVHQQSWPAYDPALAVDETVTLVVQVNGKVRDRIPVPAGLEDGQARERALASERVRQHLGGRTPRQVIVVGGHLVNVVT